MQKLGLINILIGFLAIFLAACAGPFLALNTAENFIHEPEMIHSWKSILLKSSHAHTNLFGILHICIGLTFPYSQLSRQLKFAQTIGLCLGTIAMSFILTLRAFRLPSEGLDTLGLISGFCLSLALLSIALHCYGIGSKVVR